MTNHEHALVDRMETAADRLNTFFQEIAAEVPKYSGVTAEVKILEEDGFVWHLALERTTHGWVFLLNKSSLGGTEYEQSPLLNASRRMLVLGAKNISRLLDALRREADEETCKLEDAGRDLEKILMNLRRLKVST